VLARRWLAATSQPWRFERTLAVNAKNFRSVQPVRASSGTVIRDAHAALQF
jgi:hypothetical protein